MDFIYNNDSVQIEINGVSYFCDNYYQKSNEKLDEYGMLFLYSPYYTAELDYKKVLYTRNRNILGWLFPLTLLEESDLDIIRDLDRYLKLYADIAIRKMITWYVENKGVQNIQEHFKLSDIFNPDIKVFIYRTSIINISDYKLILPSLYNEGMYYVQDPTVSEMPSYTSSVMTEFIEDLKRDDKKQITLYPIEFIKINPFVENLYKNILPKENDVIHRFISLYQIFEILMDLEFEYEFFRNIKDYCNNMLCKNDFSDRMISFKVEKVRIDKIMDNITLDAYMTEFISTTQNLFNVINNVNATENNYGRIMYALRNTLVHNMSLIIEHEVEFNKIVEFYEKNIFYILKNKAITLKPEFIPWVIDVNNSKKTNMRQFRKYLSEVVYCNE